MKIPDNGCIFRKLAIALKDGWTVNMSLNALVISPSLQVAGCDCPFLAEELLLQEQERCRKLCLDKFNSVPKMGGSEMSQMYAEQLSAEVDQLFEQYKVNNQSKNLFVGVKTPLVFVVIMTFLYVVSGFLGMLGLDPVASIFNWVLFAALVALITWGYVRYSGHNREIGRSIDHVAEVLSEKVSCATGME